MSNSSDIDSEIENDFKKNSKISFKSLIVVLLCFALLFVFLKFHSRNIVKLTCIYRKWNSIYRQDYLI